MNVRVDGHVKPKEKILYVLVGVFVNWTAQ